MVNIAEGSHKHKLANPSIQIVNEISFSCSLHQNKPIKGSPCGQTEWKPTAAATKKANDLSTPTDYSNSPNTNLLWLWFEWHSQQFTH